MGLQSIEKKTIYDWMIRRTVLVLIFYAITHLFAVFFDKNQEYGLWLSLIILLGIVDTLLLINAYIMPFVQYKKYNYEIRADEIYLEYGVIFKHTIVLPIVQLQHIAYTEGPIQRLFNLASLHISTAGADLKIEGLMRDVAIDLVNSLNTQAKQLIIIKKQEENNEIQ